MCRSREMSMVDSHLECVSVKPDEWLGRITGRPVFSVTFDEHYRDHADELTEQIEQCVRPLLIRDHFVYAKVPVDDTCLVRELSELEFSLIDTHITFAKEVRLDEIRPPSTHVRSATPEDRAGVASLAGRSFRWSRFHRDPGISDVVADKIKHAWADNYFLGARGDEMHVAAVDEHIVGFVLLLRTSDSEYAIDLIAVDAEHRGRGIGADLIRHAESRMTQGTRLIVGTQLANRPSTRCYEKLGFRMCGAEYVLHYHGPQASGT